jgi:hypothetical protein
MKHPARGTVTIPRTGLGATIAEATAIQRDLTDLLRELEQTATGHPITKPGAWRHHPEQFT